MPKKLIETALPLDAINRAARGEKDVHTGLPGNLHTWWSRKPLAAARAVLLASILNDPAERLTPEKAKKERLRLFRLIERASQIDAIYDETLLKEIRAEIKQHVDGPLPTVVDPFCGGGSIPIEGQRLGFPVYAADLNPVAVVITKALVEMVPKVIGHPPVHPNKKLATGAWEGVDGLVEDVRHYGGWMESEARKRIGHLYPAPLGAHEVVSWLWARTVPCPNPACRTRGVRAPLIQSFALSTHIGNEAYLVPKGKARNGRISFDISKVAPSGPTGTVGRGGARCLDCDDPIPFNYIREAARNDEMDYQLVAIVDEGGPDSGRKYLRADAEQERIATSTEPTWVPETELPEAALGFRVQKYGLTRHADLFSSRQLIALTTFSDLVAEAHDRVRADSSGDDVYADAVALMLAFAVDRLALSNNTLVRWLTRTSGTSKGTGAFDRPVVSMIWMFSEGNVFGESVGSWKRSYENPLTALKAVSPSVKPGRVEQRDATTPFNVAGPILVSTDPPYYDYMGYSHLSDFFYIWLRRALSRQMPDLFSTVLVPKAREISADPHRFDNDRLRAKEEFQKSLSEAFTRIREKATDTYPTTFYYAFKETEADADEDEAVDALGAGAWETMLQSLVDAEFQIVGTWPMRTEQKARIRAVNSNALASSIVLVCRPRPTTAPLSTRRDFMTALKNQLPAKLRVLQEGSVAPVDFAQAAIGPGMAIFSQYSRVVEADGRPMGIGTALQLVNQEIERFQRESEFEADAETQVSLRWFEQYGFSQGPFGEADVLARAKNTSVAALKKQGMLEGKGGNVALATVDTFGGEWVPAEADRVIIWDACHRLLARFQVGGEAVAAELAAQLGTGTSEDAKLLAYRLYTIATRKNWAESARQYNDLVAAWPEIQMKAAGISGTGPQKTLDLGIDSAPAGKKGRKKK